MIFSIQNIFCLIFGFASTIYEILFYFVKSYMVNDLPYDNMRMRIMPQGSSNSLIVLSLQLDLQWIYLAGYSIMIATIYTSANMVNEMNLHIMNHMLTIIIRCSYQLLTLSVNTEQIWKIVHSRTWLHIELFFTAMKERTFFSSECQFCLKVKECGHEFVDVFW